MATYTTRGLNSVEKILVSILACVFQRNFLRTTGAKSEDFNEKEECSRRGQISISACDGLIEGKGALWDVWGILFAISFSFLFHHCVIDGCYL